MYAGTLEEMVLKLLGAEISPASMFDFEMQVAEEFREFARQLMELARMQIRSRPDDPEEMPHDVEYQAGGYRRLNQKTRNTLASATLFGTIELWRYPYALLAS